MSQYPYQPPPSVPYGYGYYGQNPVEQLLAPARRASVVMFVLAGLMLPCGLLFGLAGAFMGTADLSQMPAETAARFRQLEQQLAALGMTAAGALTGLAVGLVVLGIALIVVGVIVRRGGMGGAVAGIVVGCVLTLIVGFYVLASGAALVQGNGEAAAPTCVFGLFLLLLIFMLVSLFGAARNSGQVAAARAQFGGAGMGMPQYPQGYPPPQQQAPQQWGPPGQQWPGQQGWGPPPPPPPPPSAPPPGGGTQG